MVDVELESPQRNAASHSSLVSRIGLQGESIMYVVRIMGSGINLTSLRFVSDILGCTPDETYHLRVLNSMNLHQTVHLFYSLGTYPVNLELMPLSRRFRMHEMYSGQLIGSIVRLIPDMDQRTSFEGAQRSIVAQLSSSYSLPFKCRLCSLTHSCIQISRAS
jgi:hypothetical protein